MDNYNARMMLENYLKRATSEKIEELTEAAKTAPMQLSHEYYVELVDLLLQRIELAAKTVNVCCELVRVLAKRREESHGGDNQSK